MSNEYKKIDLKILMKNEEIACVSSSMPLGTEDGEPLTELYASKNLQDLRDRLMNMRFDIEDFPQEKLCFHLDNKPWIQVEGKGNHPKEFPIENETYDKYSNEERTRINITVKDADYDGRKEFYFDKTIGFYESIFNDDKEPVESIKNMTGLTDFYNKLYDTMQTVENFPKRADFYIDDELFLTVNRMHEYHLQPNEDLSSGLILDHGSVNILKLETVKNDDGTISLKRDDHEIMYRPFSESDNGCIRDNDGNTNFKTVEESRKALDSFLNGDKEQGNRNIKDLDILNVNIDGERICTYINNKRSFVGSAPSPKLGTEPKMGKFN